MSTTVRWAVLGTAAIAVDHVIPAIQSTVDCEVLVIASREARRAAEVADKLNIPRAYGSYEEALADPEVDCVYVPLPNSMHTPWVVRAAEAGKAVLCEKPMALTAADALRMREAAERAGVLLAEGFMYRYHAQFRWLLDLVRDGTLGTVRTIRGSIGFVIGPPPDIRLDAGLGGGALLDVGCYPLDAMCLLFGTAPVAAHAVAFHQGGVDRACAAVLEFPDERIGVMDASFRLPWLQAPLELAGDEGVARLHNAFNPGRSRCAGTLMRNGAKPQSVELAGMNSYQAMVESFSDTHRSGRPPAYGTGASVATATAIDLVRSAFERSGAGRQGRG